ncbi:PREDICTED: uncharacterized protein LOC108364470 isoform X2 [Rhagoletis zephyria]|uniref:uncharacterized protein LOC108364470 isoform X2 n=1 Tax=Rhagoletis zephyria TaxID=28612 RepID=UPI00081184BE|nr:PREDICTED: uncharacterized protein LOC108364470 isoform X2 [Rhagoletis zephyria]
METQRATTDKIDQLLTKIDRQGAELISLRSEVSSIKARVCGEAHKPKLTLPMSPLVTFEAFEAFEESIKEEQSFKNLVMELVANSEKTYDKFIRSSWRLLISDDVARQCSWRGTDTKKCVRGLRITLAIHAFKQKFALEDSDFDRVTQKFFQYAQERLARLEKCNSKIPKI